MLRAVKVSPLHKRALLRTERAVHVVCMAKPLRIARVSKQLHREISELFILDKNVLSRLEGVSDSGLTQCATITDVSISGDLQVAKVYIALHDYNGDENSKDWKRILQLQPYVRKIIGQRMSLRRTPEIRFILDKDFDKMFRALDILERERQQEEAEELGIELPPLPPPPPVKPDSERRRTLQRMSMEPINEGEVPSVETMFTDMF